MEGLLAAGSWPPRPSREEQVRTRLLFLVRRGEPPRYPPGSIRLTAARRGLGGGWCPARMLRGILDELVRSGKLIEAWLGNYHPPGRRPHVLLLPRFAGPLRAPVVRARGREDVLLACPVTRHLVAREGNPWDGAGECV